VQSIVRDISERRATEERQRLLVEGVSAVTGESLFRSLVRHLAAALDVRHAFVAERTAPGSTRARTLAFWSVDHFARNQEYDVAGTPCEAVFEGRTTIHPRDVQRLFPEDRELVEMEAVGYLGFPLRSDPAGDVLGHLVAIDSRPLAPGLSDSWVLRIFASRAAAEIERRRIEEQLLQARKIESVSLLAGGIAHDFNNLLMGVLGNVSLARHALDDPARAARRLDEAERAGERAKRLSQQLLTLAKGGAPVRRAIELPKLLRESAELALSGSNVRIEFDLAPDLWPADADAGQIGQVIENLVINAVQAMPGGGTIRVQASNVRFLEEGDPSLTPGRYVRIRLADDGVGIGPEQLQRVFDPYFSTKEGGSGLGLTTSYSIVSKHDGRIEVDSVVGRGATFTIHLPAHEGPTPDRRGADEAPARSDRRRVLVMDDEEMVRAVVGEMLSRSGFSVDMAEDGKAAVALYREAREKNDPYDAVLLDLTVRGGMGGLETLRILRELDPGVHGIVCSGYSDDPVMSDYERYGFRGRIAKPFVARTLARTLDEVLGSRH